MNTKQKLFYVGLLSLTVLLLASASPTSGVIGKSSRDDNSATTANGEIRIPVKINMFSHGLDFTNVVLYLNADGHYHLKGNATNTLPVTKAITTFANIEFQEKSSETGVKRVSVTIDGPIEAGKSVPFDVDTGYLPSEASQLEHLQAYITY